MEKQRVPLPEMPQMPLFSFSFENGEADKKSLQPRNQNKPQPKSAYLRLLKAAREAGIKGLLFTPEGLAAFVPGYDPPIQRFVGLGAHDVPHLLFRLPKAAPAPFILPLREAETLFALLPEDPRWEVEGEGEGKIVHLVSGRFRASFSVRPQESRNPWPAGGKGFAIQNPPPASFGRLSLDDEGETLFAATPYGLLAGAPYASILFRPALLQGGEFVPLPASLMPLLLEGEGIVGEMLFEPEAGMPSDAAPLGARVCLRTELLQAVARFPARLEKGKRGFEEVYRGASRLAEKLARLGNGLPPSYKVLPSLWRGMKALRPSEVERLAGGAFYSPEEGSWKHPLLTLPKGALLPEGEARPFSVGAKGLYLLLRGLKAMGVKEPAQILLHENLFLVRAGSFVGGTTLV